MSEARRPSRHIAQHQLMMLGAAAQEPALWAASEPSALLADDYAATLHQLAALNEQGIINAQEFEAKWKQILGV